MAKVKFELNYKGVGELLKTEELQDYMQDIGDRIATKAGSGYAADTKAGKIRAHTFIKPTNMAAYFDNLKNNTLLKALR